MQFEVIASNMCNNLRIKKLNWVLRWWKIWCKVSGGKRNFLKIRFRVGGVGFFFADSVPMEKKLRNKSNQKRTEWGEEKKLNDKEDGKIIEFCTWSASSARGKLSEEELSSPSWFWSLDWEHRLPSEIEWREKKLASFG